MIRRLLQLFFSHPTMGPQLIQRLSETRPIRAAARATAYAYLRGKQGQTTSVGSSCRAFFRVFLYARSAFLL